MRSQLIAGTYPFVLFFYLSGCISGSDNKSTLDVSVGSGSISSGHHPKISKEIYLIDSFNNREKQSGTGKRAYNYYECIKSWEVVETIFRRPNPFRNDSLDAQIFSAELNQLMAQSKETENLSRITILHSKNPTDKPLLIEGEIFTSLYEGFTKINSWNRGYFYTTKAKLPYDFENEYYHQKWTDTMVLMYENNEWKFHDVLYAQQSPHVSLQERLKDFIRSGKMEQKHLKVH